MNSVIVKTLMLIMLSASAASAAVISLPENELPSESVLPKTDNKSVVLNRTVQKDHRFSLGVSAGQMMDEIFYNGLLMSVDARYNDSEKSAWGLRFDFWTGGATSYSDTFASSTAQLQFEAAPARQMGVFALRSFDLYYGKISWGKEVVTPMHFSWLAMGGVQKYESEYLPAIQGGGQLRLYVGKNTSADLQYVFSLYQKVDPTSVNVRKANGTPDPSSFEKRISLGQIVQLGMTFLF